VHPTPNEMCATKTVNKKNAAKNNKTLKLRASLKNPTALWSQFLQNLMELIVDSKNVYQSAHVGAAVNICVPKSGARKKRELKPFWECENEHSLPYIKKEIVKITLGNRASACPRSGANITRTKQL
jgi:hypothetical protein